MDLQVGGSSRFSVGRTGNIFSGGGGFMGIADSVATDIVQGRWGPSFPVLRARIDGGVPTIDIASHGSFRWSNDVLSVSTIDLILARDAANTLAQRNGVAAQAFNLYNTYTDASNYERGFMRFVSNVLTIGAEAAGTGTNRLIRFASAAPSAAWEFKSTATATPTFVLAGSDRSVTLYPQVNMLTAANGGFWSALDYATGASNQQALRQSNSNASTMFFGLIGPAAGVMQINNGSGRGAGYGASIETFEMTAPAAPPTDGVRIYAEDNGSGKTRLMALFATGAAQQIAIEP
jgi:hypothetical protein